MPKGKPFKSINMGHEKTGNNGIIQRGTEAIIKRKMS